MSRFARFGNSSLQSLLLVAIGLLGVASVFAEREKKYRPPRTAAHSTVDPSFVRERLPDGQWKPITYAFGKGNLIDPTERDKSLNQLSFHELGAILSKALLTENYVPTPGPEETDLVIVVSWGKTITFDDGMDEIGLIGMSDTMNRLNGINRAIATNDAAGEGRSPEGIDPARSERESIISEMITMTMMNDMFENRRRRSNYSNAKLLGYAPSLEELYSFDVAAGPQKSLLLDLEAEIESDRYFVILQAFDFQKMWKEKEKKLLWVTRFSIRAKGRNFDEELAAMAMAASSLFGNESDKFRRNLLPGKIRMGELEVISVVDEEESGRE
ncbi:hypothetical protein VDG1235_2037 [Verrucomicrobiia bacterium DG1235]|nr:hypothetical protein VDG1235_2037 [Verrucomicrobiae bacterium DG1235]